MRWTVTLLAGWCAFFPGFYSYAPAHAADNAREQREEAFEESAKSGVNLGADLLQGADLYRDIEPGKRPEGDNSDRLYLDDVAPGAGSDKSREITNTLKKSFDSPADLPNLTEQYDQMQKSERGARGRSYRGANEVIEEGRPHQLNPDEIFGEGGIFQRGRETAEGENPYQDALFGDCETTTITTTRKEQVHMPELYTCQAVYAPEDKDCAASRDVAFQTTAVRPVIRIESVAEPRDCPAEGDEAYNQCQDDACVVAGEMEQNLCLAEQCSGLEGEALEECEVGCARDAQNSVLSCQSWNRGCQDIEDQTYDRCVFDAGPDPGEEELAACRENAETAGEDCEKECQKAQTEAFSDCTITGGQAGQPLPYTGEVPIDVAVGGSGQTVTRDVPGPAVLQITVIPVPGNPYEVFPVYNASPSTTGGEWVSDGAVTGTVGSYGSPDDLWRYQATLNLSNATYVDVQAAIKQVTRNSFDGCNAYMDTAADGFCKGSMRCTATMPPSYDGVPMTPSGPSAGYGGVLWPWHSTEIARGQMPEMAPRLCRSVQADPLNCDFFLGDGPCWEGADGGRYCIDNDGSDLQSEMPGGDYLNDCAEITAERQCTRERPPEGQDCVGNAEGPVTGRCYVQDRVYDCGSSDPIYREETRERVVDCGSPIRGMGTDLVNVKEENNKSFRRAAVGLSALKHTQMDMECPEDVPPEDCNPTIFEGENFTYKIPVGSDIGITPDCCETAMEAAGDVTYVEYVQLLSAMYSTAQNPIAAGWLAQNSVTGSAISGASEVTGYVKSGFRSAFESMANSFGFNLETATETASAQSTATSSGLTGMEQYMAQGVYDFLSSTGQQGLANSLFTTNSAGQVTGLAAGGQAIAMILNAVMLIFLIYNLLKIIGHIVFRCEEDEIKLGFRKKTRSCHYLGKYCEKETGFGPFKRCVVTQESYCCYNSPLNRILAEEIKQQLDMDWGEPENAQCDGLTIEVLSRVNFDALDLREWEAMLTKSEILPGPANEGTETDLSFESLTPARAIAGQQEFESKGPDGNVDSVERTMSLIQRNARAIATNQEELKQEPTERHDQELQPWYADTTQSDDSGPPEGLEFGGGDDTPQTCDLAGPPAGLSPYDGVPAIDTGAFWPVTPQQSGAMNEAQPADLQPGEYLSIPFTPTASQLSLWPVFTAFSEPNAEDSAPGLVVSVSQCPGDFSQQAGIGCVNSGDLFSNIFLVPGLCELAPGQRYYANVVHGSFLSPGTSTCDDPQGCRVWVYNANLER